MMFRSIISMGTALALCGSPGLAQQTADAPVVVTGKKLTPKQEARLFVRQIASETQGQLSRFAEPICPLVIGLPAAFNQSVSDRIRAIATEAGIAQAPAPCTPNIVLIVARDSTAIVKMLRRRYPQMFDGVPDTMLRRARKPGPVHVWSTVEVRDEDGLGTSNDDEGAPPVLAARTASRIVLPSQMTVLRSIIVLAWDAVAGKSLTQISDYAAMRTLAGATPPGTKSPSATILRLFDAVEPAPTAMTALDQSYLRGLYRSRPTGRATTEMEAISRQIVKDAAVVGK